MLLMQETSIFYMNKELIDQSAHFGSCLGFTLLTVFPYLSAGALVVLVWAITREYYQHKVEGIGFFQNLFHIDFVGLDLLWSYGGIALGLIIGISWFFLKGLI